MQGLKFKYGETFLNALIGRVILIHHKLSTEVFYAIKWILYWVAFMLVVSEFFLMPFTISERLIVSQYLFNRYLYKTKHSYLELIKFKYNGTLSKNLEEAMYSRE